MSIVVCALFTAACGSGGGGGSAISSEGSLSTGAVPVPVVSTPAIVETRTAFEVSKGATVIDFQTGNAQVPGGAAIAAGTALSVNRSTASEAEDRAGNLTTFAANVARITDRGLWVEDGATNSSPNATNPGAWGGPPASPASKATAGSRFKPVSFSPAAAPQPAAATFTPGRTVTFKVRYRAPGGTYESGGALRFNFHGADGSYTFLYGYTGGIGGGVRLQQGSAANFNAGSDRYLGDGVWEMQGTLSPVTGSAATYGLLPDDKYNSAAGAFVLYGTQMQVGSVQGSWIAAADGVRANETVTYTQAFQAAANSAAKVYAITDVGGVFEIGKGAIPHSTTPIRKIGFFPAALTADEKLQWAYGMPMLRGVNIGCGACQGTAWPDNATMDFYIAKHVKAVRLPFLMERAQPSLGGALDETYMRGIDGVVARFEAAGISVILDMHNFQLRGSDMIGGTRVTNALFADVWGKIALRYLGDPKVILELMNEPTGPGVTAAVVLASQNAATTAIRDVGFKGYIFRSIPGYSAAHEFNRPETQDLYTRSTVTDSGPFAFDLHEYIDQNSSGTGGDCVVGANGRIINAILWARRNGFKINLGETGAIYSTACNIEMPALLNLLESNRDVVIGWQEWLNGLDPGGNSPQMINYFGPFFAKAF